jgi:phage terminase large subunit-like protein
VSQIIKKTPGLRDMMRIYVKSVVYGDSFIQPLGSDSDKQDGFDPSWGVVDEYHAHRTDEMLNILESGMGSRRQPVIDVITTAGFKKEYPCYTNLRRVSIDILRGLKKDDSLFTMIFELDKDDDWHDESVWVKANPNLGVSVKLDFLRNRYIKAVNEGGTKEVDFLTKNLNMWTDSAETWIPDDVWMRNQTELPNLIGRECWVGMDLASRRDFTALCFLFPINGTIYGFWKLYLPKERSKEENDYRAWAKDGWITETDGDTTDYDYIKRDLIEARDKYKIKKIAFDRWNSSQLVNDLTDLKFPMAKYGQGFASMSAPTKELETMIYKGEFKHDGNPVLRWMNANITLKQDAAGNVKPDKDASANKIDGMVSLIMALGEYMAREKEYQPNIRIL